MSSAVTDEEAVRSFRKLLHLAQQLRYLYDRQLHEDGLTTAQATALTFADQHPDAPLSYSRLAELMATSHQNVAQIVQSLERKDFMEVRADPDDGRVRRVHVTETSRRYWEGRDVEDVDYLRSLFTPLSPTQQQTLNRLLDTLGEHVEDVYRRTRHG